MPETQGFDYVRQLDSFEISSYEFVMASEEVGLASKESRDLLLVRSVQTRKESSFLDSRH